MNRLPLYLIVAIPAAGVLMGIITLIIAFSQPPQEIRTTEAPLTKTSWQRAGSNPAGEHADVH
jgi:hypothetical protein